MSKIFLPLILVTILLQSCDDSPPIPEDKFMHAYVDILIAQDTTTKPFSMDSLRSVILAGDSILPGQYDLMIDYYNEKPEKWMAFFDSVTVYAEQLKLETENQP